MMQAMVRFACSGALTPNRRARSGGHVRPPVFAALAVAFLMSLMSLMSLVACGAEINDRQAAMSQGDTALAVHPRTTVVGAAVGDTLGHAQG